MPCSAALQLVFENEHEYNGHSECDYNKPVVHQHAGIEKDSKHESSDRTSNMSTVTDVAPLFFHPKHGIEQIPDTEDVSRNGDGNEKEIQVHPRIQHDGGIDHSHYRSGSANCAVIGLFFVKAQPKQATREERSEIDGQETGRSDIAHHRIRKEIKGQHVEEQVGLIDMQKTGREKSNSFPSHYRADLKLVFLKEDPIAETFEGYRNIGDYDD